ncbi:MAG: hypothetical protein MMC23_003015 [Stictis urceolatum]|nr:hypothetical protein [Stictis urceolata]
MSRSGLHRKTRRLPALGSPEPLDILEDNLPPLIPAFYNSIPRPYLDVTATQDLGSLSILPTELLHLVLVQLDLETLESLRTVNRLAAQHIAQLRQYIPIKTHARIALRSIFAIRAGRFVTLKQLYSKLRGTRCEDCGELGPHLYLLTCTKLCGRCLQDAKSHKLMRLGLARFVFRGRSDLLERIPRMRSIPGVYSRLGEEFGMLELVDKESAYEAALEIFPRARECEGLKRREVLKKEFHEAKMRYVSLRDEAHGVPSGPSGHTWDGESNGLAGSYRSWTVISKRGFLLMATVRNPALKQRAVDQKYRPHSWRQAGQRYHFRPTSLGREMEGGAAEEMSSFHNDCIRELDTKWPGG